MSPIYLLDTNALTGILKKEERFNQRLTQALADNALIVLSPIAFYEIKRGLLRRDATGKLSFFEHLAQTLFWDDLKRGDWDMAAQLWAEVTAHGSPHEDADLLLAAHARRLNAVMVTANERHFDGLGLVIENWAA